MYKPYDSSVQAPPNGRVIKTNVVHIKRLKSGAEATLHRGSIACGNDTVTITIPEKRMSISVTEADIRLALGDGECGLQ